ncbi:sigma-70 family RNA polymerase sigma factor [Streptosporangium sp. DT93]|uniref:sigma-70 family RNA polymerase sigma factor n=1 Tax=Streptosporangium sp. DT93 TaxID=3393428 RepID=UPI003CE85658
MTNGNGGEGVMPETGRDGPDTAMVSAARAGDRRALDALVAGSLPLVYNIVGRALNGHGDVDDVVQETLLRVVRSLPGLRDAGAYRSWLVAIAVRQVRDHEQHRRAAQHRTADLESAEELPDPASDFAAVTILRLGLTDQRREVAEATRWLDGDDQTLLALWWLEETGELGRAELAGALGLSGRHAAVRVQRMKEQVQAARSIVRALRADSGCAGLRALASNWNGVPSPLWRKRLSRHIRDCDLCQGRTAGLLPIDRLLAGLPLLPLPVGFALHHLQALPPAAEAVAHAASWGASPAAHASPSSAAAHASPPGTAAHAASPSTGAHAVESTGRHGLASQLPAGPAVLGGAAAVVVAALLVVGYLVAPDPAPPRPGPVRAQPVRTAISTAAATSAPPASPTPSARTTARATPRPSTGRSRSARPSSPPARVTSARKGVGVWKMPGLGSALAASGAGWYYNWSARPEGGTGRGAGGFVPMIWGSGSVTPENLAQARRAGPYLLAFNEPDLPAQANMTVERALSLWPQLMSAGRVLGSPSVAFGADTPGGWLDRFMSGAAERGYRVDFIALHWYGADFRTEAAVGQLRSYIQAVYRRYRKPIWLTEYALIDFSNGTRYADDARQAAFVTASTRMLATLPYVRRYAWFGLPSSETEPGSGLFRADGTATRAGRAFQAAR